MRRDPWITVVGASLAVLAFLAAFYFFSSGVLFDSGCHRGDEAACETLRMVIRLSSDLGIAGLVIAVITAARVVLLRRARARA